jgi:carbon monoxide dehydrogenase subunit G
MNCTAQVDIKAGKEAVWKVITDFENAVDRISGIEKLVIDERPDHGLVGLRWTETRTMFGKTATETMWITAAEEESYYDTRAESHGAVYTSRISVQENNGSTMLTMDFHGAPQTFGGKVMMFLMGWMFRGATRKALQQDLEDIKAAVESGN